MMMFEHAAIVEWLTDKHSDECSDIENDLHGTALAGGFVFDVRASGNPFEDETADVTWLIGKEYKDRQIFLGMCEMEGRVVIYSDYVRDYGSFVDVPNEHEIVLWVGPASGSAKAREHIRKNYESFVASEVASDLWAASRRMEKLSSSDIDPNTRKNILTQIANIMRKIV